MSRRSAINLLLVLCCVMPLAASAQEPRIPQHYFVYTSFSNGNCDSFTMNVAVNSDVEAFIGTLVKANGQIYSDEESTGFEGDDGDYTWNINDVDSRLMQKQAFPLPKSTPIRIETTMYSGEYAPLWRGRADINKCNKNHEMIVRQDLQADTHQQNGSFESLGMIGGYVQPFQPQLWERSDSLAFTNSGSNCGTVAHPGTCVLRIVPHAVEKTQTYMQTVEYDFAMAGKRIELAAFQRVDPTYTGTGTITATLTFENGQKATLQLTTEKHAAVDAWKYAIKGMAMPARLVKAVIKIKHKGKVGAFWDIDGLSLATYRKNELFLER